MLAELDRHPHARAVLGAALAEGRPSHAYLFHGAGGSGKRRAARAVASELLAAGSADPEGARRRVASGSHPDLTWVIPSGAHEILVSDIDGPVVAAASKTPFESSRRVFVIEHAEKLGDETANRMLKTLEEPPPFVHLILLTERLGEVLPTIRSRCQLVRFDPPGIDRVAAALEQRGLPRPSAEACARLGLGDASRARELAAEEGPALRAAAERFARAVLEGTVAEQAPWQGLIEAARARGERARAELEGLAEADIALYPRKEQKRVENEWLERVRRARRREETSALDLALALVELWFADLACLAWGAPDLVRHRDRLQELEALHGRDPRRLRRAIELVEDTRLRFRLNVSEQLACEALAYRLEEELAA